MILNFDRSLNGSFCNHRLPRTHNPFFQPMFVLLKVTSVTGRNLTVTKQTGDVMLARPQVLTLDHIMMLMAQQQVY